MNWQLTRVMSGVIAAVAGAMLVGCATTEHRLKVDQPPAVLRYEEKVVFEKDMNVPWQMMVSHPDDPKEVVLFALSLSKRGRHQTAGEFLMEAAGRFDSRQNEFAIACLAAAANEFLAAGAMDQFVKAIRDLRRTANKYQWASFDEPTSALIALGDIACGGTQPTEQTPRALKQLYREKVGAKTQMATSEE